MATSTIREMEDRTEVVTGEMRTVFRGRNEYAAGQIAMLQAEIEKLERALRLAAGELSTYRDTDKHPQDVYDGLCAEAAGE